ARQLPILGVRRSEYEIRLTVLRIRLNAPPEHLTRRCRAARPEVGERELPEELVRPRLESERFRDLRDSVRELAGMEVRHPEVKPDFRLRRRQRDRRLSAGDGFLITRKLDIAHAEVSLK